MSHCNLFKKSVYHLATEWAANHQYLGSHPRHWGYHPAMPTWREVEDGAGMLWCSFGGKGRWDYHTVCKPTAWCFIQSSFLRYLGLCAYLSSTQFQLPPMISSSSPESHLHPPLQKVLSFFSKEFLGKSCLHLVSCQNLIRSCPRMQCSVHGPRELSPACATLGHSQGI